MTPSDRAADGRVVLMVVGAIVVLALAWAVRGIIMLVAFSLLVAYALDPLVTWLTRLPLPRGARAPRSAGAAVVILALVAVSVWAIVDLTPRLFSEAAEFISRLPENLEAFDQRVQDIARNAGLGRAAGPVTDHLRAALPQGQSLLLAWLGRMFGNVMQLGGLLLMPVLAFYLLAEREEVRASLLRFVPEGAHAKLHMAGHAVERALASYVRGQAVVCAVSGGVMTVALGMIGVPHALLLGLVVALAEILPFIGFWIAAIPILLVGLGVSPVHAWLGLGAYVVSNTLISAFVTPRVMGKHLTMHPFVVTVSVLAGGELLGPAGVLLALPLAAIAQALVQEFAPRSPKRARA